MKLGLVLSGGGARGIAHLGIIKAFEEEGISFDLVSGVSAGALVGAFYCAGYSADETLVAVRKTNFYSALRPAFNWRSLLLIEKSSFELKKYFPEDSFSALKKPLFVTTTDISKGKVKVYKKGQLIKPLLASCAIPVVFEPVRIGKRVLVDGGVLDNLPTAPIRKKVDKIIALHCNPIDKGYKTGNWKDVMERSMMLTATSLVHSKKKNADIYLEPAGLSKFKVFDFKRALEIFTFGYDYGKAQIEAGILDKLLVK